MIKKTNARFNRDQLLRTLALAKVLITVSLAVEQIAGFWVADEEYTGSFRDRNAYTEESHCKAAVTPQPMNRSL